MKDFYFIFLFFLTCPDKTRGGEEIQTSDLRFMRRGLQPIELPLGNMNDLFHVTKFELLFVNKYF
jgi:hypothetical protein